MICNVVKFLIVFVFLVIVGQVVFVVLVEVGGWIFFDVGLCNQCEVVFFLIGMCVYLFFCGVKDGEIWQQGNGNVVGFVQVGCGNVGFIQQQGNGYWVILQQNGDNNVYGIFQYGCNMDDEIVQNGNNCSGVMFSFGW